MIEARSLASLDPAHAVTIELDSPLISTQSNSRRRSRGSSSSSQGVGLREEECISALNKDLDNRIGKSSWSRDRYRLVAGTEEGGKKLMMEMEEGEVDARVTSLARR